MTDEVGKHAMRLKVRTEHLERKAYVYVRQSTPYQVENNLESQRRQYDFAEQAVDLGWSPAKVTVIDEDQGKSGSRADNRSGFSRLVTAVGMGEVGIVMSLEASRLARNSPDWHNLIYMSRYTGTLIADETGVYDPSIAMDRMILGLRGQMSELELETSIHRMIAGRMNKAKRGEFLVCPPAGYEIDDLYQLVITSDEAIRQAIKNVFVKFDEYGSARGVYGWWQEQGLQFPVRRLELRSHPVVWLKPKYGMFLYVLHNPIYAGVYAFGRTKRVRELDPEQPVKLKVRQVKVPMQQWPVLIQEHHEAYITWAQYQDNQERIWNNRQMTRRDYPQAKGPVREGGALLQGLVRCGHCGRAMNVSYGGSRPCRKTKVTQYRCWVARRRGQGKECQLAAGKMIDAVVVEQFLAVTKQAAQEASCMALEQLQEQQRAAERMWEQQLEKAQFEAARIKRQFDAVEPENRLVARTLESRWEAALQQVDSLKAQAQSKHQQIRALSEHEKARAKRLSYDLEAVWEAATTTQKDRKQLLRAAIEEVQLCTEPNQYRVKILWKGGAVTQRQVPRRRRGDMPATATSKDIVETVRVLATELDDAQISRVLNKQGRRTGHGNAFTAHKVAMLRNRNGIAVNAVRSARDRSEGPFTADQAAVELAVCSSTIHKWLRDGILPGRQLEPCAPWKIVLTDELRRKLTGRGDMPDGWVGLNEAAKQLGLPKQQVAYMVKTGKLNAVRVKVGARQCWKIDLKSTSCGPQLQIFLPTSTSIPQEAQYE